MQAFFSHESPPLAALHLITFLVGKAEWFECNSKEAASKKETLYFYTIIVDKCMPHTNV